MAASPQKAIILALTGPSSSGKTTLARLLRDIIPDSFILHQDDFYLPEEQCVLYSIMHNFNSVPLGKHVNDYLLSLLIVVCCSRIPIDPKTKLQNWDCPESLDITAFTTVLDHIHTHGTIPSNHASKEDKNAVGQSGVSPAQIAVCQSHVEKTLVALKEQGADRKTVAIVDGFLLLPIEEVKERLDTILFLRLGLAEAKKRREARKGYVTLEGFWEDPPGYVEDVVWPNYVKYHKPFFMGGDVEGEVDPGNLGNDVKYIEGSYGLRVGVPELLEWAVDIVCNEVLKQ
jgi:nicotinamide/nicotinate riboside kinase